MCNEPSPIACDLTAIDPEQREHHQALSPTLIASADERLELPDGFAWRHPNTTERLMELAVFISNERLCCPFYNFVLEIEPEGGPIWLRLTGRAGVKEALAAGLLELNLLND